MKSEEIAPPPESWEEHLKVLSDPELAELAKDYNWLDDEAHTEQQGEEFHRRRKMVITECQRRGLERNNRA